MRSQGSAAELEARRRLAVQRVAEGWKQKDVTAFLGVTERAVYGWVAAHRKAGDDGLRGKPHPGAKPRLSKLQEASMLSWLAMSPQSFGDQTDPWATRRLAEVIARR
jgi:transposase